MVSGLEGFMTEKLKRFKESFTFFNAREVYLSSAYTFLLLLFPINLAYTLFSKKTLLHFLLNNLNKNVKIVCDQIKEICF